MSFPFRSHFVYNLPSCLSRYPLSSFLPVSPFYLFDFSFHLMISFSYFFLMNSANLGIKTSAYASILMTYISSFRESSSLSVGCKALWIVLHFLVLFSILSILKKNNCSGVCHFAEVSEAQLGFQHNSYSSELPFFFIFLPFQFLWWHPLLFFRSIYSFFIF